MSKRDLILLLEDMLDSALKIRHYTNNMNFDSFLEDNKKLKYPNLKSLIIL